MSREIAIEAETMIASALRRDPETEERDRAAALRAVSRALALDPDNQTAVRGLARLLLEPPRKLPEDAARQIDQRRLRERKVAAHGGNIARGAIPALVPLLAWMGIRDVPLLIAIVGLSFLASIFGWLTLKSESPPEWYRVVIYLMTLGAAVLLSGLFGAFILTPMLIFLLLFPFSLNALPKQRSWLIGTALASVAALGLLELTDRGAYVFPDGMMCVTPRLASLPQVPTLILLLVTMFASICIGVTILLRLRAAHEHAEERLFLHAWYLEQLAKDPLPGLRR